MGKKKDLKKCKKLLTDLLYETRTIKMYLEDIDEKPQTIAKDDSDQQSHAFGEWMMREQQRREERRRSLTMEDIQLMCPKGYW